ncbi:hypothetical protein MMC12_002330 [Toensbergia leucococca]|nr:hypothetical protein [Toensbergia leucococca]
MADLLTSLIIPCNSPDSFHSTHSHIESPMLSEPSTQPQSPPNASTHTAALQAAGLPIYDVEAYLNDPKNKNVLDSSAKKPLGHSAGKGKSSSNNIGHINATEPVQLGAPKTSHHVSALYLLCQQRGLTPSFEIEENDQTFGGRLIVGNAVVEGGETRWQSKKEAREELAGRGTEVVKGMTAVQAGESSTGENWVGKLLEFHNAADPTRGPVYTEYAVGTSYACECAIDARPTAPFGSKTQPFSTKKAARTHAAKEAMHWLIQNGHTNPDGSARARKKLKLGAAVRVEGNTLEVKRDATFTQKVADLCPLLGLSAPEYRLAPTSPSAPHLLSGAAYFPQDSLVVPGSVGECKHVFGKKSAKEECARGVFEYLRALAEKRGVSVGEE